MFFLNPFRKRTKPVSGDPKAGNSEDSTVGGDDHRRTHSGDRSGSTPSDLNEEEQRELKKTGHFLDGLLVQNVPYDKDMQETVERYSMARGRDAYNEDEEDDTVKSFADGSSSRRIAYNEVPDQSTRTTECQERMNANLGKKAGNLSRIMNLP